VRSKVIFALLILVGLINFFPVLGVVSAGQLAGFYDVSINDSNLLILLKHRALLFGLVGGLMLYSAFRPEVRTVAIVMGLTSMLGFVFFTMQSGEYNESLKQVMLIDIFAIFLTATVVVLSRNHN